MQKYVYAIGNCSSISHSRAREWRQELDKCLINSNAGKDSIRVIDITDYYSYEEKFHETDGEIADFCLRSIIKSDVVVVNNFMLNSSSGSGREIGIARALNKPIFIINESYGNIYPWDLHWAERVFSGSDAIGNCANHILKYVMYDFIN